MVNRNTNHPFGKFGFPFFGPAQPMFTLGVEDNEKEVVIEGRFEGFEKENIKVEIVRNGIFIHAEQKQELEEGEDKEETQNDFVPSVQRFVPINFPFKQKDVSASFQEEEKLLTVKVQKNDANRRFIKIE